MSGDFLEAEKPEAATSRRAAFVLGAVVFTAAGLAFAFWLGSWAFDMRRYSQHVGRLERLLPKEPQLEVLSQALEEEGTGLLAGADSAKELEDLVGRYGRAKADEVREKGQRWAYTRVFAAPDMLYFIYFDAGRVMRDFTCVSR